MLDIIVKDDIFKEKTYFVVFSILIQFTNVVNSNLINLTLQDHYLQFNLLHFSVNSYSDESSGIMGRNSEGKVAMLSVMLRPKVEFVGENIPSSEIIEGMHETAHSECFIASSVKTEVICQPVIT